MKIGSRVILDAKGLFRIAMFGSRATVKELTHRLVLVVTLDAQGGNLELAHSVEIGDTLEALAVSE